MRKSDGTVGGSLAWSPIKLGGLGFAAKIRFAQDGSWMLTACDVSGAYRRSAGKEKWDLVLTSTTVVPTAQPLNVGGQDTGVFEIDIAKSDPNIALMAFRTRMLRSTDKGLTWADDSLNGTTGIYMSANVDDARRTQWKLLHDPSNANVAYFGPQRNRPMQRLSTGWSAIASLPVPDYATLGDGAAIAVFAVDPTSATTGSSPNVRKSVVYCAMAGHGVYKSTDGGATFSALSAAPGTGTGFIVLHMICGPDGKLWLAVNNGTVNNLYHSADGGSTFVQHTNTGDGVGCFEIDPKNSSRFMAVVGGGKLIYSTDAGANWSSIFQGANQQAKATSAIPAANAHEYPFRSGGSLIPTIIFHPTLERVWSPTGWGPFWTATPFPAWGTKAMTWIEDVKGMEQLVAYSAMIKPDGTTFLSVHDRGILKMNPDRTKHATSMFPYDASIGLTWGCNSDYATDDPNFVVARNFEFSYDSCKSLDNGETWARLSTSTSGKSGGMIICSTKNQLTEFFGQNGWPKNSQNQGSTWSDCVFAGFSRIADGTDNGFQWGDYLFNHRFMACVDKSTGYQYCFNYGPPSATSQQGVWRSTDGGANWTKRGNPSWSGQDLIWALQLICSPNGHLFIHAGLTGSNPWQEVLNYPAFRSEDGGATWTQLGQINEPYSIACGAPKPGSAYSYALYSWCWKGGVFGLYRSDDKGSTWVMESDLSLSFDFPFCLAADQSEFRRVVTGFTGTGFFEGRDKHQVTLS